MSYEDDFEDYDSSSEQLTATPGASPSIGSRHFGAQYWDSNFPSLLTSLGVDAKLPKIKRIPPKRKSTGSSQKSSDTNKTKTKTNFAYKEELGKRNEGRWLKIDNVVREKMDQFDDYYTRLVSNNELRREENERNAHLLYNKLWLEEEKKRQAVLKDSTYDRIWRHHALMRQRGEDEWHRKMAKKTEHQNDSEKKKVNIPICSTCISSNLHLGHKATDIFERQKDALRRDLKELEESILPKYQEAVSLIPVQKDDLSKHSLELSTALKNQGEVLRREIDAVIQKTQSEIDVINAQYLVALDKKEDEITGAMKEISQVIQDLKKLLDTGDVCLISKYTSRNGEFRRLPPEVRVSIPNFQPQISFNREQLHKQFGSLSSREELLNVPKITDIATGNGSLRSVSCLSDEQFWLCPFSSIMKLYNLKGELEMSISTKSGNRPVDIAVKKNGDLLYADSKDNSINIVSNTQIMPLMTLKGWIPRGLCCPTFGDLLVIMDSDDKKESKVVRYTGSTETQSIQWINQNLPLYWSGDIKYLCENSNLDICVSDSAASAIVVVSAEGKFRFKYTGRPSVNKESFHPRGIATDSQSKILTTDSVKNRIHILDQDGQFLRFIENCGLRDPWGLCMDSRDNLFVTEKYTGHVKKIQYYK